jgi:FkbM family methyltransferase
MLTRLVRWAYRHRSFLKRIIPLRRPVLLRLHGFRLYVRPDDWAVGARIAVRRAYEPHVTAVMRALFAPGMTVVDIGANIGYYTLLAATRVGPTGRVIAIEPSAENCDLLRRSVAANGLRNVTIHPCAAADIDGVIGFHLSDSNGQIRPRDAGFAATANASGADGAAQGDRPVPARRLDALLADEPRLDLIKMDIEGAEGRALAGMTGLLRRHHPLLVTEFSPAALETISDLAPRQVLDALRDLGYNLRAIEGRGDPLAAPQDNDAILARLAGAASEHLDLLARPIQRTVREGI